MFLQIHVPTVFAAIIVAGLTLAFSLGWASRSSREGVGTWAMALSVFTGAFALLALRGFGSDWHLAAVGTVVVSAALTLFLVAVRRFHRRPTGLLSAFTPTMVLAVAMPLVSRDLSARILLANPIFLFQIGWVCLELLKGPSDFPTRGRGLVICGLAALMAVMAVRIGAVLFLPKEFHNFFQPSPVQSFSYFGILGGLILSSNGFVMMAKERSDERLRIAARRDRLTGCWNRVHVEEVADQEMARLRRYGQPVSLIIADLDRFKTINDCHGHAVGDEILAEFAAAARETIRTTDVLGRWGGEEFVVILPMSDLAESLVIAERLRANIEGRAFPADIRITVSLGLAACFSSDSWGDWLRRADAALYRSKESGRNRVTVDGVEIVRCASEAGSVSVPQLIWRANYLCGEETIDRQHRALFNRANALFALGGEHAAKDRMVAALGTFLEETARHFADEEHIFTALGYANASHHARSHHELLARARILLGKYVSDQIGAPALCHFVIHEVFANHILVEDQTLGPLFHTGGEGGVVSETGAAGGPLAVALQREHSLPDAAGPG